MPSVAPPRAPMPQGGPPAPPLGVPSFNPTAMSHANVMSPVGGASFQGGGMPQIPSLAKTPMGMGGMPSPTGGFPGLPQLPPTAQAQPQMPMQMQAQRPGGFGAAFSAAMGGQQLPSWLQQRMPQIPGRGY